MYSENKEKLDESLLLKKFNSRDSTAFSEVYSCFYNRLFHYTSKLYTGTEVVPCDKIQDLFLKLWENKNTKFVSLSHIKSYLYLSIQNSFREYLSHNTHIRKYAEKVGIDSDFYVTEMIETETMSILNSCINQLPDDCGIVIKLYIEGWDVKDISEQLGIPQSTIYRKKEKAISILSDKMPKKIVLFMINILN